MALGTKRYEKIVALTDGRAFRIDEETFKSTMGDLAKLLVRSLDVNLLASMIMIPHGAHTSCAFTSSNSTSFAMFHSCFSRRRR